METKDRSDMVRRYDSFKRNNCIIVGLCMILVMMGIAYAAFASQLKISGTSTVTSNWDIEITNIETDLPSEYGTTGIDGYNITEPTYTATTATFSAGLESPGDQIAYIVEVTNKGTIDGKVTIGSFTCGDNSAIICGAYQYEQNPKTDEYSNNYIEFSSDSNDYSDLEFTLKTGEKHYIVVQVGYDSSVTSQPDNLSADIKLTLDYEQYDLNNQVELSSVLSASIMGCSKYSISTDGTTNIPITAKVYYNDDGSTDVLNSTLASTCSCYSTECSDCKNIKVSGGHYYFAVITSKSLKYKGSITTNVANISPLC